METINVKVNAGKRGGYYNLVQLKEIVDRLQEEIGGEVEASIVEEPDTVTTVTGMPDHTYIWTSAPAFLVLTLQAPETNTAIHNYNFIFEAGDNFTLSVLSDDNTPIVVVNEASVMTGSYNKVCVSYIKDTYYVNILNYKV